MKIILNDETEVKITCYENKESSVLIDLEELTIDEVKAKFTESNTEDVKVFNDLDEQVAEYTGYVLGNRIVLNQDSNTIEVTLEEKTTKDLVKQNTADITAINEAIASLAEIVGGE